MALLPNVVLLTNYVPPYRLPLFRALEMKLGGFRILESIAMDPSRPWSAQYDGLKVETQRTFTFRKIWKHPRGFHDRVFVHIPYDTLGRLSRLKPDVVIGGELGARTVQSLIYRRLHGDCRLIIWVGLSEHTEVQRGMARHLLRKVLLPCADAILVNGASGARYVKRFGVADQKIFLAPQATDHCRFLTLPLERNLVERRRLLYAGQLVERKGLYPFLSVLSTWCKTHSLELVEFWLVGDGPEREKLRQASLPPNLRLRFCGNVPFNGLPDFYAHGGILAFPTLADEWGLVVNEAMTAGLPILGSVYSQAVEELVDDGTTGWTFRPNRTDEMYAALDRALTTPPNRLREMGTAARKAVEHLTPEFAADRILDAIRFVCGDQACGATASPKVTHADQAH